MGFIDNIVSFYVGLFWTIIVVGNIIRLIIRIKCFKIKECHKDDCRVCRYCKKYYCVITEEDRERLRKWLLDGTKDDFY
ncbi:MAG: hypothetical protein K2P44_08630 [Lachnospiraceae bacterium]|nr:hypothetical protein [Lachnospiraceae bacterium]